jgi:hypothetical protein
MLIGTDPAEKLCPELDSSASGIFGILAIEMIRQNAAIADNGKIQP